MPTTTLYDDGKHKNLFLEQFEAGLAVSANQHLIVHGRSAMLLDPGGHKVYNRVLSEVLALTRGGSLKYLFLSHQDPDVVAATNGWLMTTDAEAIASKLWIRFIPHFGLDHLVESRLRPIPDEGMVLDLEGAKLMILPAHFLHSPGNFQVYDPTSRTLYSGDLGASLGTDALEVKDFDAHVQYMEGFHRRYMASNRALRAWAGMVRQLDIELIAPQHGSLFRGKPMVERFIQWCEGLSCGVDLIETPYALPKET